MLFDEETKMFEDGTIEALRLYTDRDGSVLDTCVGTTVTNEDKFCYLVYLTWEGFPPTGGIFSTIKIFYGFWFLYTPKFEYILVYLIIYNKTYWEFIIVDSLDERRE